MALGHDVTIIVPSAILAELCRVNAPEDDKHEFMFEDCKDGGNFDLCLSLKNYQYISLDQGVLRCMSQHKKWVRKLLLQLLPFKKLSA